MIASVGVWTRIAFRNLLKNRRRSLYTIAAVGIGFAAFNIFGGFTSYIFSNLRDSFIYIQGNGHVSVFKKGFRNDGQQDPGKYLIPAAQQREIESIASALPGVVTIGSMLQLTGLASNGDVSTIFVGRARVPSQMYRIQQFASGLMGRLTYFDGEPLRDDTEYGVGIARGLGGKLGIDVGGPIVLMAPTVDGQINALDAEVFQFSDAAVEVLEDKYVVMPLGFAQSLYGTDGVSEMNVLLERGVDQRAFRDDLAGRLAASGIEADVYLWRELSPFYIKVEKMFQIIFLFIFIIVFIIVAMSVVNTVSMAVLERSREIGTLRAMGVRRRGIVLMFSLESAMLGTFGCLLGVVIQALGLGVMALVDPVWTPPQTAKSLPLEVYVVPVYLALSFVCLVALSFAAGILPARRVARSNIVDALGHV